MKPELENKLFEKYPKLFANKDKSMQETCMCWGIAVGDGWFTLLDELCDQIIHHDEWKKKQEEYERDRIFKERSTILGAIKFFFIDVFVWFKKKLGFYKAEEPYVMTTADQVKEKYGGLRFYISGGDNHIAGLIDMAEALSYHICETCGQPGKPNDSGWISTSCDQCRQNRSERVDEKMNQAFDKVKEVNSRDKND